MLSRSSEFNLESRFRGARRQALLGALMDAIRQQPSDMLALEAVRACLNIRGQRSIGYQVVPVNHIIGSEGRYSDFDRRFLPRTEAVEDRWRSIDRAMLEARDLPPVDLYKISDVYFVRDGNHRVSVARRVGLTHIDAYVTELLVDVPLTPELSVHNLLFAEEYSDFLEWTNLHDLRPAERIEFSELGGYLDLIRHINIHRYALNRAQNRELDRDEAVAHWYDTVYMPLVQLIREHDVLQRFAGRTEGDLYRWIIDNRQVLSTHIDTANASGAAVEPFGRKRGGDAVTAIWAAAEQQGIRLD